MEDDYVNFIVDIILCQLQLHIAVVWTPYHTISAMGSDMEIFPMISSTCDLVAFP